ncbi:hypothetical protein ACFWM0_02955 [Streptomyces sp. NPDC058405]|uniref:hypothetical protein n=1 Tax=Streptomyces sp. NPDC058405 TaxID=3346482 RepID=UPI0036666AD5
MASLTVSTTTPKSEPPTSDRLPKLTDKETWLLDDLLKPSRDSAAMLDDLLKY